MNRNVLIWPLVVLALLLGGRASAFYLPVDIAYPLNNPLDPTYVARHQATSKSGWFIWAAPRWSDMWRHDGVWAGTNVDGPIEGGLNGTGVNIHLKTSPQDGHTAHRVYGLTLQGDGVLPTGTVQGEPLANSYLTDHGGSRDFIMTITDLPAGTYYLLSYHSDPCFYSPDVNQIASITVEGDGVVPISSAHHVPIQRTILDSELIPSEVRFSTDGTGDVVVTYETATGGKPVLNGFIITTALGTALDPIPTDKSENVCPGQTLCWSPGTYAAQHDIYIGTNFNDVNNATTASGLYEGRQTATCYEPSGLVLGTTYYWRVDEVNNSHPDSPWKGEVWQFTTNDGSAFDPSPEDGETRIELDAVLTWTPGCSADTHTVYFGTNLTAVTNATPSSHPDVEYASGLTTAQYDPPGELEYIRNYYWRVDEVSGTTTWTGDVWTFRARAEVQDPNLLLWYKFDENPPNSVAYDSSGNEQNGSVHGDPNRWEPLNGRFGGCRIMSGSTVSVPFGMLTPVQDQLSISFWTDKPYDRFNVAFDISGPEDTYYRVHLPSEEVGGYIVWFRAGNEANDIVTWDFGGQDPTELEDWHHWVFIKDEVTDEAMIYFDSLKVASISQTADNLHQITSSSLQIGHHVAAGGSQYTGRMDDFRVYNRVLTQDEIDLLTRGGDLGQAWKPTPRDGGVEQARETILSWKPGDFAVSHDVYFGTSFDDVNDATTATSIIYVGRQGPNTYDPPGLLELDTTYFWRIDEINEPNIWKGNTWKFTVANYLVLDDFESYHEDLDDLYFFYGGNWLDGIDNSTGSTLYLGLSSGGEPTRSGVQSLYYNYYNGSGYSEAERVINTGERDWTVAGVKMLTMFFYGDPGNDAGTTEQMYCGIEDAGSNYADVQYGDQTGEDMSDLQVAEWHEWNIAISDFTGTTPGDVRSLFIGFGERGSSTPGGMGTVYFDDIRFYLPRCVPDKLKPEYDFSNNCIVDITDVGIMADSWLASDACLPVSAPTDTPVGWWKLDGNANDSAGTAHGTAEGSFQWITGHIDTGAIEFTGDGGRVLVPNAAQLNPTTAVTAMAWVNYSVAPGYSARIVAKGADQGDHETFALQLAGDNAGWFVRDVNTELHGTDSDEQILQGEWAHTAGSYDGDKVRCYTNGRLGGEDTVGSFNLLVDANGVGIGNRADALDRAVIGAIDDVRIYNVALSDENVAYIATQGSGYVPLLAPVNIYDAEAAGSKAVNFKDLAELMTAWLEQKLWPQ